MAGIYTASRVRHAHLWRELRERGYSVTATWIDEAGPGQTADMRELWQRCVDEAKGASFLIVYREDGEPLKGALVEVGAALGAGVPVLAVGFTDPKEHSWLNHPLVAWCDNLTQAFRVLDPLLKPKPEAPDANS